MGKLTNKTMIELPKTYELDRDINWVRPNFEPYNGIVEQNIWALEGLIAALGFVNGNEQRIIGSGVMVAPGVCLTATHVIQETLNQHALLFSFPTKTAMRIWSPLDFHALEHTNKDYFLLRPEKKYSDVAILSYSPFSKFTDTVPYYFSPIEVALPKIGERLWAVGYREVENDGVPTISFFSTSGLVVEQHTKGRGAYLQGACIEVAMKSLGGMSGGPVFNEAGRVVGVISTCMEGVNDDLGPTFVTLVWPALISEISATWPLNEWPNNVAGLQSKGLKISPRVLGSAVPNDDDSFSIKFHRMNHEEIHQVFIDSGEQRAINGEELYDYIYEILEDYLECEGLSYIGNLSNEVQEQTFLEPELERKIKNFKSIGAETYEGLEDIDLISATKLESGLIGLDLIYDIRSAFLTLEMDKAHHDDISHEGLFSEEFHNYEENDGFVTYEYYVRPFYRVTLSYDPLTEDFSDLRFHQIVIKK